jgi:hypothetical protein
VSLPPPVRAEFVKIVRLLASTHDGERANTVRIATDILRVHRLTWDELPTSIGLCSICAARVAQESRRWTEGEWARADWRELAHHCLVHHGVLTPRGTRPPRLDPALLAADIAPGGRSRPHRRQGV